MEIYQQVFSWQTKGRGLAQITQDINECVRQSGFQKGLCNIFLAHTSASIIFCENYDSDVLRDLEAFMQRFVPDGDALFKHTAEGPDDMPAHIRTIFTQNSLNIPVNQGKLTLGSWQGVFLYEHRTQPHQRNLTITIMGI